MCESHGAGSGAHDALNIPASSGKLPGENPKTRLNPRGDIYGLPRSFPFKDVIEDMFVNSLTSFSPRPHN